MIRLVMGAEVGAHRHRLTAAQKQQFLLSQPSLARVAAIRDRRFIVIPYDAATPGPENVAAVETLARALYPAAFDGPAR